MPLVSEGTTDPSTSFLKNVPPSGSAAAPRMAPCSPGRVIQIRCRGRHLSCFKKKACRADTTADPTCLGEAGAEEERKQKTENQDLMLHRM